MILPDHAWSGISQETQDVFEKNLIKACIDNNENLIHSLVSEHRLWVKPIVDKLTRKYMHQKINGNKSASKQTREITIKISQIFQDTFGEKSLSIATNYLDLWSEDQIVKKLMADSLFDLGTGKREDPQQHNEAIGHYQQAMDIYSEIGDERGKANILGGLGFIYWSIDHESCLSYYQEALEVREKVDDKQLIGESLNGIGSVYYLFITDYETAIEYYEKAVLVRTEIGDWSRLGNTLPLMASAYENLGQLEMAIKYYQQSFDINKKTGNHFRMAEAMFYSGSNLYQTGKYPEALQDLEIAIEIYRNLEDTIGIGDVLSQMGFVYANLGDYTTAIEKCREALKLMEQADYIWGVAGVYNTMGIILQGAGRTERALTYYHQSLEKYEELDDKQNILGVLNNLGTTNFDLKEYDRAEEYHYRALQLSQELKSKIGELHCLINLANDQTLLGKLDKALSNYESALPIARSLNSPETVWKTLVGMAENYKLRGDYDRAIEYNEEGFKIIEEMRVGMQSEEFKTSYMARERYAFEDVINMLAELHEKDGNKGYDLKAFQYAQRSKSRALIDLLVESQGRVDSADYQYSQPASLEETQSSCLDDNTVFLEYSLGDSNSYLWVITSDLHQLYKLPDRNTIREQIETMRFAMLNPEQSNIGFLTQSGYTLYNQLIKPAEEFLSENSNLVILPDGILNYLPFEVLITREQEKDNKASFSDLPYLVKKYPISYGQSSSVMISLTETQNRNEISLREKNNLIAFGDPVYEIKDDGTGISIRESFSRLEHSGREVENIASLFQEGSADIFLRYDATEENVKNEGLLAKFSYIHFATHGLIDEEKPDFSSLVLTQKKNSAEDGYLQAAEIFNLDMNADLVVLSACQTGLGKMIRGEGMVGLTRAFMYAGTPSVIVSLWNVSDISTALLMEKFYENLIKHKESKTDALRRAQLSLVRDETYAHPFYWASFVLIGEWH